MNARDVYRNIAITKVRMARPARQTAPWLRTEDGGTVVTLFDHW